ETTRSDNFRRQSEVGADVISRVRLRPTVARCILSKVSKDPLVEVPDGARVQKSAALGRNGIRRRQSGPCFTLVLIKPASEQAYLLRDISIQAGGTVIQPVTPLKCLDPGRSVRAKPRV